MRVQDAAAAVRAFAREQELRSFTIECCAIFDELLNGGRSFFHQHAHGFRIAQAIARCQRVLLVEFNIVVVAESGSDASLRVYRRRFAEAVLGQDEHRPRGCELNCGAQPGDTRAYHQEIRIHFAAFRGQQIRSCYNDHMPSFRVATAAHTYEAVIERGVLRQASTFLPPRAGTIFVVTTQDVWRLHGAELEAALQQRHVKVLFFPGGEERKRLSEVETLAEQMVASGGDRTSVVVAFGGGIVNDLGGFLAAIFMRGIPVLQIPTTLLAQVDAAVGGKTGANLILGKNLIGAFHQPLAVLIDPDVIATLPEREYRAGLQEIIKCGVIRDAELFRTFETDRGRILAREHDIVEHIVAAAVRIKAEVVSEDERESGLRRILNFGHTIGHTLEAETGYVRFLHGEAVGFGMIAAARLAVDAAGLAPDDAEHITDLVNSYGPFPTLEGIRPERLFARLASDKKTLQGKVHFVLPVRIGAVKVVSGIPEATVMPAIEWALARCATV